MPEDTPVVDTPVARRKRGGQPGNTNAQKRIRTNETNGSNAQSPRSEPQAEQVSSLLKVSTVLEALLTQADPRTAALLGSALASVARAQLRARSESQKTSIRERKAPVVIETVEFVEEKCRWCAQRDEPLQLAE